jgi:hypothetical protein
MAADEIELFVGPDGVIRTVYDDALVDLLAQGETVTRRASHVEPYLGGWAADMRPSGGCILGLNGEAAVFGSGRWFVKRAGRGEPLQPFPTRQAALDAERAWLAVRMSEGRA